MKKLRVIGVIVAGVVIGLTGCSSTNSNYSQVCEDKNTGERVSDSNCNNGVGGAYPYLWLYYPYNYAVPAIGYPVSNTHYVTTPPKQSTIIKKIPAKGGYVAPAQNGKAPSVSNVKPKAPTLNKPAPAKPNSGYKAPAPVYKAPPAPRPAPVAPRR